jgi:pimeloyl-ACP methyl ester carboxylesterase
MQPPISQMPASMDSVLCKGVRVQFRAAGSGPAIVLVHGLLGYSFSWRNVIPILAHKRRVFAVDMPGAGFSDCSADLDCRLAAAADRLVAILDALQINACHLVGSSYGGATAAMLAARFPARVMRLVLVSPANPWSKIGRKRLALLRNPALARIFPALARGVHPLHKYLVRRMWGDPQRITSETLNGYALPLVRSGVFEHAVKIVHTWRSDMAELEGALPEIQAPTLLVWGSKDRVVDPASADLLRRRLRRAEIALIEGAGHLPYEECPEEFCHTLEPFLDKEIR